MGSAVCLALTVAILAASCSDDEAAPATSTTPASTDAPEPELVDRGVIRVPPARISGVATTISTADPDDPRGRQGELTLTRCQRIAPGRWDLGGHIRSLPDDGLLRQTLWFQIGSDVVSGFTFDLDAVGEGEFTATIDLPAPWASGFERHQNGECVIGEHSPVAVGSAPVSVSAEPLAYEAPAGSLQALGVGARLDQADSLQLAWARHAWLETALPFAEVWVPGGEHRGRGFRPPPATEFEEEAELAHYLGNCLRRTYEVEPSSYVGHEVGCAPALERGEPVASNPAFFWDEGDLATAILPKAILQSADVRVTVGGNRADVEALVGELEPVANLVIDQDALDRVFTTEELAAAKITDGPSEIEDLAEHARIDHELGAISVWTATDPNACERCNPDLMVALLEFEAEGRPNVERIGGGWDGCYSLGGSWSEGVGAEVLLVLADPSWTVEMFAPEPYGPPELVDGVWYAVFPDAETTVGVNVLGIFDAAGDPVDCFESPDVP